MIPSSYEWTKWAFDGVGGAAILGLIGWGWRSFHRKRQPSSSSLSATNVRASDNGNAFAMGAGAKISGAPIVLGSNNTVNISPQEAEEKNELASAIFALVLILGVIGLVYFSVRHASSTPAEAPRVEVGLAFGDALSPDDFGIIEEHSCITKGVTCLGEERLRNSTIEVPFQRGTDWVRIVFLVSTFNTDSSVSEPHVVVSTPNTNIGLEYANHREGLLHNRLEFTPTLLESTSNTKKPDAFIVDILFRSKEKTFPVTVEVWGEGLPRHTLTFNMDASISKGISDN
jgi:hypothetical protein